MFLTQPDPDLVSAPQVSRPETNAALTELFGQIQEFLQLSRALELTLPEEHTLLSLVPAEWDVWRSLSAPPLADAPPLLTRRLTYALALLRRMALAVAEPASQKDFKSRSM